ncbi:caspase domain-containing protein [Mycena crocata]|nr:caspase domain-containing protein [Mycena crocata]
MATTSNGSAPPESAGAEQIFAFIVGINEYLSPEYSNLRGSVNDAKSYHEFLRTPRKRCGLQVPSANIAFLLDEAATRSAIISTFQSHLINNPKIPDNGTATIIFVYAGHGNRIEATGNLLPTDRMIETICPHDEHTLDADGQYVHGIPDYVLGWLLRDLAAKKGNNITVIVDCCHSGGMGREVGDSRSPAVPSRPVPIELDDHLWKDKSETALSHSFWSPGSASHVLLAACHQDETAREIRFPSAFGGTSHGRFTYSLIKCLRRPSLSNTTYTELLNSVPTWSGQTPHCEGANRNRLVLQGKYPATGRGALALKPHPAPKPPTPQTFLVDIGSVEGVVPGTEFGVHAEDNTLVCTLVAHSVQIHQTVLVARDNTTIDPPAGARAVVTDWKNDAMVLHVFLAPDFPSVYTQALFHEILDQPTSRKFVQSATLDEADVVLRILGIELVIERRTSSMIECGSETRMSLEGVGSTLHLPNVVNGIAHFNYFLERHSSEPLEGFSLEMHRLMGKYPGRKPDPTVGNMIRLHEARFRSQQGARYGFTICNETDTDLFAYLFYFDPTDYTILCWYKPEGVQVRSPLRSHGGRATVGMGGEKAFEFLLPEKMTSSSGFLKLFVSTDHLNLDWIQQETSPFDQDFEGTDRLKMIRETFERIPKWDALCVLLTMTAD